MTSAPVTIYTTHVCPYCVAAKRLLSQRGMAFDEVDLTDNEPLRRTLSAQNGGWRTVPMIFLGSKFIGGYTELVNLDRTGAL